MKIAIPTEDGLTINQQMMPAKGFLVLTIQLGELIQQEMRWNLPNGLTTAEEKSFRNLADCDKVIVREIGYNQRNDPRLQKKEVITTEETIITNVLIQYLQNMVQKEANTCCCP
jgi:predicted Fe-Mo cluster-binding NifX family protein